MRSIDWQHVLGMALSRDRVCTGDGRRRHATLDWKARPLSYQRFYRTHTVPGRSSRCQRAGSGCLDRRSHDADAGDRSHDQAWAPDLEYPATTEAATNKLFRAAQFELPEPGRWELRVEVEGVHGRAAIGGEIDAAEPLPRWREMWPWIGWPALAIVLFCIHQTLARCAGRLISSSQPSEPIF